jgi:hypothetical protein
VVLGAVVGRACKTYHVQHVFRRVGGAAAAEMNHLSGPLDLSTRPAGDADRVGHGPRYLLMPVRLQG